MKVAISNLAIVDLRTFWRKGEQKVWRCTLYIVVPARNNDAPDRRERDCRRSGDRLQEPDAPRSDPLDLAAPCANPKLCSLLHSCIARRHKRTHALPLPVTISHPPRFPRPASTQPTARRSLVSAREGKPARDFTKDGYRRLRRSAADLLRPPFQRLDLPRSKVSTSPRSTSRSLVRWARVHSGDSPNTGMLYGFTQV